MSTPTEASAAVAQPEESAQEAEFARMHINDLVAFFYEAFTRAVARGTIDEDCRKRARRIYAILKKKLTAVVADIDLAFETLNATE